MGKEFEDVKCTKTFGFRGFNVNLTRHFCLGAIISGYRYVHLIFILILRGGLTKYIDGGGEYYRG